MMASSKLDTYEMLPCSSKEYSLQNLQQFQQVSTKNNNWATQCTILKVSCHLLQFYVSQTKVRHLVTKTI